MAIPGITALEPEDLVLVRSDAGDGGWSLHAPGATDDEIAQGYSRPLASGPSTAEDGAWMRPNAADYEAALITLARQAWPQYLPEHLR